MERKLTKCFVYGFKSFRLTVEQFVCSPDEVDWLVRLEEWDSKTKTYIPSNNKTVQNDLVARALFRAWDTEANEIKAAQVREYVNERLEHLAKSMEDEKK